jgi:hypothetical protein
MEETLIAALVADPAAVPDLVLLIGFAGRSSRRRHLRLYDSPGLSDYSEIPVAAILHRAPLSSAHRATTRTAAWVARGAAIVRVSAHTRRKQADWLVGAITASVSRTGISPVAGPLSLTARSDIGPSWCPACTAVPTVAMLDTGPVLANPQPSTEAWSTCDPNCV